MAAGEHEADFEEEREANWKAEFDSTGKLPSNTLEEQEHRLGCRVSEILRDVKELKSIDKQSVDTRLLRAIVFQLDRVNLNLEMLRRDLKK